LSVVNGAADAAVATHGWPSVEILVPAHNEEQVLGGCLTAMTALDYPRELLSIVVVNDRSRDGTGAIADTFAARDGRVRVIHRAAEANPGKSSALADAMRSTQAEIVVLFDADYLPRPDLLKQLLVPFQDPLVGATMGRVVPSNSDANMLTRLLDLERRAGYTVDQRGRELCGLVPQFGGTVGGIRMSALGAVGGWREGHLTEDTELTFRLLLAGWKVRYLDEAACYEEVPEDWGARYLQVRRWAYGHNDCMLTFLPVIARSRKLDLLLKLDGIFVLTFYFFPALAFFSTFLAIPILAYGSADGLLCQFCTYVGPLLAILVLSPFLQIAVAARSDGQRHVSRAAPLMWIASAISILAATQGFCKLVRDRFLGTSLAWDKTRRYRAA
jgi:cellulose synthase/poly-beta-1,6-N-acetylglucosamine synthase-like glycosyltransferase